MIRDKLRTTIIHRDSLPGSWETPLNPDGYEALAYIDHMIEHIGYIVKIALDEIDDDEVRRQIKKHAYQAIRGAENEQSRRLLAGTGGALV